MARQGEDLRGLDMSVEPLLYWVKERESVRKKKEAGLPPPWSGDPIFQTYRFCNIRRRDDRVSRWLIQNVLTETNLVVDTRQFIMFAAFCRWCNWPPVIAEIIKREIFPSPKIKWKTIVQIMDEFKANKQKTWTGAYMINAKGCVKGGSKAQFIVEQVIEQGMGKSLPLIEMALKMHSRREVWCALQNINCFGSFMSGQCVDDLAWTSLLSKATDTNTWCPQGPGSIRGFNRVLGLPLKTRHSEEEWCANLQAWREQMIKTLGQEYEDVDLMSQQNICCEFDKYERTRLGEGRPRSKYRPETVF